MFVSASSACNLIVLATASPANVFLCKYLSTATTLAAGSHLILNIRAVGRARATEVQESEMLDFVIHLTEDQGREDSIEQRAGSSTSLSGQDFVVVERVDYSPGWAQRGPPNGWNGSYEHHRTAPSHTHRAASSFTASSMIFDNISGV